MRSTGIWVPWSGSRSGVPEFAVVGGYIDGNRLYFARSNVNTGGNYKGKHVGRYDPRHYFAYIPYAKTVTLINNFEVTSKSNSNLIQ